MSHTSLISTLTLFFFTSITSLAYGALPYYGPEGSRIENHQLTGENLRQELHRILSLKHTPQDGDHDIIAKTCKGRDCYQHISLGYKGARKVLMGELHLQKVSNEYFVEDIYCQTLRGSRDGASAGPGRIPRSTVVNTEHTWPQSRFNRRFKTSLQKSDLHALFPVSSRVNSIRSNNEFAEVDRKVKVHCGHSKSGKLSTTGRRYFEPPAAHKGNVARALFYFATHYKMKISATEESFLRKWHKQDPVDAFERWRHNKVAQYQRVRNPYIDYPDLVDQIPNF